MKNHVVFEPDNVYDIMNVANIGDTIEYIPNNQEGYALYLVVASESCCKQLQQIADIHGPYTQKMTNLEIS